MPQGKGTYGSKVGRPPKKKYNKGGNVDPFSTRNPKGVPAEQLAEMMENQNMANEGIPTSNAQERSQVSPDVTEYKEGGKVDSVAAAKLRKKYKTNPKTGKTDLSKRVGKDSPGYKKGKYWLRNKGKYTDIGSPEHTADLKALKE